MQLPHESLANARQRSLKVLYDRPVGRNFLFDKLSINSGYKAQLSMKNLFHRAFKGLAFLVLAAGLAAQADAQLVKYQFTGTNFYNQRDVGTKISGTVTLDVGATPDYCNPYNFSWDDRPAFDFHGSATGYDQYWSNGGFSVDAVTDSGLASGPSLGGYTRFYDSKEDAKVYSDGTDYSFQRSGSSIENYEIGGGGTFLRGVIVSGNDRALGDGVPYVVPNPWDPSRKEFSSIVIYEYNDETAVYLYGTFTIDSFTLVPTNIIIGGIDTGIVDFQYQGKLVSKDLAEFAAAAKNHGDYVSRVTKLTNALMKAGLLTGKQKGIIMDAAAKSSYGK